MRTFILVQFWGCNHAETFEEDRGPIRCSHDGSTQYEKLQVSDYDGKVLRTWPHHPKPMPVPRDAPLPKPKVEEQEYDLCKACKRPLTDEKSRRIGYGPECRRVYGK